MARLEEFDDVQLDVEFTQAGTRSNLTSKENIAISFGKIAKWYEALVPTGGSSGQFLGFNSSGTAKWVSNPNVDEKVKATKLAQSTADASYYPTLVAGEGTAGVNIFDSAKINHTKGTTSAVGNTRLILGNATNEGTTNNEEGLLRIYSPGTKYHTLKGAKITTDNVEHTLPTTGGTILNTGTTSFTQTLSSGTKIGTIKINGTSSDIYAPTDTDTKVTDIVGTANTYYPAGGTSTSTATGTQVFDTSLKFIGTTGSTSAVGKAQLVLGNATASGTANNKQGSIVVYGSTAYAHTIQGAPTAARTLTLPDKTGTFALTSDIPSVPTVNDAALTLKGAGTTVTTFTANASSAKSLDIVAGSNVTVTADTTNAKISIASSHPTITKSTDTTSTASPAHGGTFTVVDSITREANGHVTKINTKTVTLPADSNTDTKVTQSATTTTNYRPILFGAKNSTDVSTLADTITDQAYTSTKMFAKPETGILYASGFSTSGYTNGTGAQLAQYGLYLKSYKSASLPAGDDYSYSRYALRVYDGKATDNAGMLLTMDGGGLTIVGGGESATALANLISDDQRDSNTSRARLNVGGTLNTAFTASVEQLILSSDNNIYFLTKCNTIADRKPVVLDTNSYFYPGTTKTGSIGTSSYMWNSVYAATIYENGTSLVSKYAAIGHTHTTTIAADSGTNQLTLAASTKYKLTAGETNFIFTTPPNTTYSAGNHLTLSGTTFKVADYCKNLNGGDWNTVTTNGWYMGSECANAPSTAWWIGHVHAHNNKYCIQELWNFDVVPPDTAKPDAMFMGHKMRWFRNSAWGPWVDVSTPTPSAKVDCDWGTVASRTTNVTRGWMAYWNGAYNGSTSNLTYCNRGAFGTIVTKSTTDYSKVTSSTTNGKIKIDGTDTTVYAHPSYTSKTSGLYKITVDTLGHVSATASVAKGDIPALDYLPLAGGTMTGDIEYPGDGNRKIALGKNAFKYYVASTSGWAGGLNYYSNDGSTGLGAFGAYGQANTLEYHYIGGTYNAPQIKIEPTGPNLIINSEDASTPMITLFRKGSNKADWRIVNTSGNLKFQSDYTTAVGDWYDALTVEYNTGNITMKTNATFTFGKFASASANANRHVFFKDDSANRICVNDNFKYNPSTNILTVGSITGTSSNVTGTVAIANGGTGATTRLDALKNLTNQSVGTDATYFLTITNSWGKGGYTNVAQAKTVLGLKSAAYTESSDYVPKTTVSSSTDADTLFSTTQWVNWNTTTAIETTHMPTTNYGLLLVKASPGPQVFFPDTGTGIYLRKKAANSDATAWMGITGNAGATYNLSNFYKSTTSRTANTVLAAPNGSDGAATFRKLVAADIPSLSYLPLTGGNVSGGIYYKSTKYDGSAANNGVSSGSEYPTTFNILDKSSRILVRLEGIINSTGAIGSYWYIRNYNTSGTQVAQKGISMSMAKDGTLTYTVSDGEKFRNAIGAGTSSLTIGTTATTAAAGNHTHNYAGSSSAGGAATSANKLNTNDGTANRPVYFSGGVPVQCDAPLSGSWFKGVPQIGTDGVMEIGRYLDFHSSNTGETDYDVRIDVSDTSQMTLISNSGKPRFKIKGTEPILNFAQTTTGKAYDSSYTGIIAYPGDTSGLALVMQSGGMTVIASGESGSNGYPRLISTSTSDTDKKRNPYLASGFISTAWSGASEVLILSSDNAIYFQTNMPNSDTVPTDWDNLKTICIDSSGNFKPTVNKKGQLGTSSLMWNAIYGNTIYENGTSLANKYAAKSHAHSYLPLAGGTMDDNSTIVIPGVDNARSSTLTCNGAQLKVSTSSNWAMGLTYYNSASTSTSVGFIGAYGTTDAFESIRFGAKHDNWWMKITGTETTITGDLVFSTVSSTTYPAESKKIKFGGGTDWGRIYYRVDAADTGRLVLDIGDDSNARIDFAYNGTTKSYIDTSGNFSGNAATSSSWATARTLTLSGQLTGSVSVNGDANMTLSGWLKKSLIYDETSDFASYAWHKFAEKTITTNYEDQTITFIVSKTWGNVPSCSGILTAHIRTGSTKVYETSQFYWQLANTDIDPENFVFVYTNTANTSCKVELWYKQTSRYDGWIFTVLKEHSRTSNNNVWTLYTSTGHGSASHTTGTASYASSITDIKNNTSGTSSNVTGTVAIANGGTGATTRLDALRALTEQDVGTSAQYFLTITNSWGKGGYTSVAQAKTVLGLKSAAYTESSDYAASDHTHPYLPTAGTTINNPNTSSVSFTNGMSGNILFTNTGDTDGVARGIGGIVGGSDSWSVRGYQTAANKGCLEISVGDDGDEGIYVRQYTSGAYKATFSNNAGSASGLTYRELVLMAPSTGASVFPSTINTAGNITITKASGDTGFYATRSDTSVTVWMGVGSGGTNHGVFSNKLGKWMMYGDASNVYLNGNAATATTSTNLKVPRVAKDSKVFPGANKAILEEYTNGTSYNLPSNHFYHILSIQGHDTKYGTQLALGMTTTAAYYRSCNNQTWSAWKSIINTDTYDRNRYNASIKAGSSALVAANIIVGKDGVYKHLKSGGAFDITYPILYLAGAVDANGTTTNTYDIIHFTITTTQSITLAAYRPVYIKGTLNGTVFTPVNTTPLIQTIPTSGTTYDYIYLGQATSSTTVYLQERHPIYSYRNGRVQEITPCASMAATSDGFIAPMIKKLYDDPTTSTNYITISDINIDDYEFFIICVTDNPRTSWESAATQWIPAREGNHHFMISNGAAPNQTGGYIHCTDGSLFISKTGTNNKDLHFTLCRPAEAINTIGSSVTTDNFPNTRIMRVYGVKAF